MSRRRTTREEKQRLVDRLLTISGTPLRNVDLTVVASEVRPWRYPPSFDFQYGDWLRLEFEGGNVEPWPMTTNPDVASLITMALLARRPLLGPPPAEVFDPVPRDDLIRAIVGDIDALLGGLESDTRNVILTLARIWNTVTTDGIRSKDDAATWALARVRRNIGRCWLVPSRSTWATKRSGGTTSSRVSGLTRITSSARSSSLRSPSPIEPSGRGMRRLAAWLP